MFNIKALTDAPAKITPKGGKKKETIAQTNLYKVLILLCINLEKKNGERLFFSKSWQIKT
jgi:hypothetical protein